MTTPPLKAASVEWREGVDRRLERLETDVSDLHEGVHKLEIRTEKQDVMLNNINKNVESNSAKIDKWGWALLGFGLACAGAVFGTMLKLIAAGGGSP